MPFTLPQLPFAPEALEPHMSAKTLAFHHGKHHQAYVTNLNNLIKDTPLDAAKLEDIILEAAKDPAKTGIFNNAAQVWNHTFFWEGMKGNGGGAPSGDLADQINASFGSFEAFLEAFKQAGATQFGSGWAWLVSQPGGKLAVTKTANAMNPLVDGQVPLLTCDVWEHAYYLDYQNRRPDFIQTFLDHLVNWDAVAARLADQQMPLFKV